MMLAKKLTAHHKDVGGIPVARLLPQGQCRTIGAWCFLDHAGPVIFSEHAKGLQVGSHPHTNLQTFTWMLDGEVWHQDSLGFRQLIRPKQVNLMTAGTGDQCGISHTEQTPEHIHRLHAVQLWIALPLQQEIHANFQHYAQLPEWLDNDVHYILTTGSYQGHTAPTMQYSPLLGVDIQFNQSRQITIPINAHWQYGILVISGSIQIGESTFTANEVALLDTQDIVDFHLNAEKGTHLMLLAGEPLPHRTLIWWNFVADSRESLCRAVSDWNGFSPRFGQEIDLTGTGLKRLIAPEVPQGLA